MPCLVAHIKMQIQCPKLLHSPDKVGDEARMSTLIAITEHYTASPSSIKQKEKMMYEEARQERKK